MMTSVIGARTPRPRLGGVVLLATALWSLWWMFFGLMNILFADDGDDSVLGGTLFIGVGVASLAAAILWVIDRRKHRAMTRWLAASAVLAWLLGLLAA